ncbi:hypothetical protein GA0061083_1458 [Pseudarthrobacter enclensis]|uniref:DUF4190 domain-containing protein n=1 Tax=Pseudarthrobacter enclensis TaxID=993070 RepID=A0A0V8IS29_9MICC|nr:hypothetical protein [Pseudarthrobacter enclensis]KSU77579.1 hypothetical protein AS031_05735 [Pseudarthrobacter enclensis]SCB90956.1 hypothetical protein GA0061083_1458 [Pseudarthrobacter enclensis]
METSAAARTDKVDALAVVSLVCAVVAVAGLIVMGMAVLAVFAVGAGHAALHQIEKRGGRGRLAAMTALGFGYAVGIFGLATSIWLVFFSAVATRS